MDWGPTLIRTIDLGYDQMLMIESHPSRRLRVIHGGVWLTEEGVLQDAWLGSGDEVALRSRGTALIEGLGAARIELAEWPVRRGRLVQALRRAAQGAAAGLGRLRTRLQFGPQAAQH